MGSDAHILINMFSTGLFQEGCYFPFGKFLREGENGKQHLLQHRDRQGNPCGV